MPLIFYDDFSVDSEASWWTDHPEGLEIGGGFMTLTQVPRDDGINFFGVRALRPGDASGSDGWAEMPEGAEVTFEVWTGEEGFTYEQNLLGLVCLASTGLGDSGVIHWILADRQMTARFWDVTQPDGGAYVDVYGPADYDMTTRWLRIKIFRDRSVVSWQVSTDGIMWTEKARHSALPGSGLDVGGNLCQVFIEHGANRTSESLQLSTTSLETLNTPPPNPDPEDPNVSYVADLGPLGLQGVHTWNSGFALNNIVGGLPHVNLDSITGLFSLPELDDLRDPVIGANGEVIYPSYTRGKTVTYEGRLISADESIYAYRWAMLAAFANQTDEGTMRITPHPTWGTGGWYYKARVLTLEIDDEIFVDKLQTQPSPYKLQFTLSLRMRDNSFGRI
jgi:hypothetical protein